MRAALLPTPGDPLLLAYWLRNFETWRDQVDELVVFQNGPLDPDVVAYDERIVKEAGGIFYPRQRRYGHDGALLWLLERSNAEHVVLCEDDAYVRHPQAVGAAFSRIESGEVDIVGSPRHEDYASSPLQIWPDLLTHEHEEVRRGLWPAFLFARRADLLATDRQFGDRRWNEGEVIEGLDMPVTPALCGFVGIARDHIHLDTLFGTTFQLRAKAPRIELVHRVRLFDAEAVTEWVTTDPPWFHVTGLSTLDYVLDGRPLDQIPDLDEHGGLWTRRMAWWLRVCQASSDVPGWIDRGVVLGDFIARTGMRHEDIGKWHDRFARWVTWDERLEVRNDAHRSVPVARD